MATEQRSSASSQPARQTRKKSAVTPGKRLTRRAVDLANLPPLTPAQQAELAALKARPAGAIDYSDIPPLPGSFWTEAERGRFYKPRKASTTIRIDADVLAWLRSGGKGYQSRINAILRQAMLQPANALAEITAYAGTRNPEEHTEADIPRLIREVRAEKTSRP